MLTWNQARSGVYWDSRLALSQRGCFFWALLLYLDTLLSCRTPMWKQITGHSCTLWLSLAGCSRACCPHPSSGTTGRRRCFEDVFLTWNMFFSCISDHAPVDVCSDGNLATKQVVFLQRPVRGQTAGQPRNQVRPFPHSLWPRNMMRQLNI